MLNDIVNIVAQYMEPECLVNFFKQQKLDIGMKFEYDTSEWIVTNNFYDMFPNMMLVGIRLGNY